MLTTLIIELCSASKATNIDFIHRLYLLYLGEVTLESK